MKYESSIFNGLKVMAKVKVFVYAANANADGRAPYEKYLYQSIGAIYVPYMSPIISIGEL